MQLSDKFSRTDPKYATELINSMTVHNDFLGENEERSLLDEILPYMRTLRYEFNHWDNVCIYGGFDECVAVIINFRQYTLTEKRKG